MTLGDGLQLVGVLGGAGILTKMLATLFQIRDSVRDHIRDVGSKETPLGPTGLFRQVANLETTVDTHDKALAVLGLDRRHMDRRQEES